MRLIPDKIPIKVGQQFVAVLNEHTAHLLDLHVGDRVLLKNNTKAKLVAIVEITQDHQDIRNTEIGLYIETWEKLKVKRGNKIDIKIAEKPISVTYIKEKLEGKPLDAKKIDAIIKDVVNEDLSDVEIAYFVSGCYVNGLSDKETVWLTESIVNNGNRLKFKKRIVADKHCIGGVAGNRTTMIVVPIITALGITMPKTSSRAITSPAGTADTMEVLANVKNQGPALQRIANKVGGFITWGGGVDLASADDKMIRARHPLSLDPKGMLLASIMAKKHSVSATHVLIDIPIGKQVKINNKKSAEELGHDFKNIGKKLGMKVEVIYSNGDEPIGNGIGPTLEAMDVMKILKNDPTAPKDLIDKAVEMAGMLIELCGKAKKGMGGNIARKVLVSGAAYTQMMRIIKAQGPSRKKLVFAKYKKNIYAAKSGKIIEIDNKTISHIARSAGAPKDQEAGIYLYKKLRDRVKKGDILFTIYANIKERLKYAEEYEPQKAYTIK